MKNGWFLLVVGFLLGLACIHFFALPQQVEIPFPSGPEASSPSDRIQESHLILTDSQLIINIDNAHLAAYANTNSMDPVLDSEATGIEIIPSNPDEINVGDIIAFESSIGIVPHRVIEKGQDSEGVYFITKGDNNSTKDPEKVRFHNVRYLLVGVLY